MQNPWLTMSHNAQAPFRFLSFKEWVPDGLRFWVYMLFLIAFQFSNGMYFTAMPQMQGELSLTMNDVKMMSHAILTGLTLFFPLAFRFKFRFTNRTSLIIAAVGLAACNLLVPHVQSLPLLVILCFAAGFLRLYGTFECFSSILPKLTPTRNYVVFLSFVFLVVLGVICLLDIASTYIIYYTHWRQVHYLAMGMLLMVILLALVLMRPFRTMPKMPLYGIDWLGMVLWAVFILSLIFVVQYGHQLDWFHSPYIRVATGTAFLALACNIGRITYIRHPYLEWNAFKAPNLANLMVLFLFLGILSSSRNMLLNSYTGTVLRLDVLNTASLKWFEFGGMLVGALFTWHALCRLKWGHKLLTFFGMFSIVVYLMMMYFLTTGYTNIEKLYLPIALYGFGHIIVFITLTVYAQSTAPFKNYFQVLCILGFIRTGIASPIGDALYTRAMAAFMPKHLSAAGANLHSSLSMGAEALSRQAMIATVQELFGWSVLLGVLIMMALAASRFKKHVKKRVPSMRRLYLGISKTISFVVSPKGQEAASLSARPSRGGASTRPEPSSSLGTST